MHTDQANSGTDELLQTVAEPDLDLLLKEYEQAGGYLNNQWRQDRSDKSRFMRWTGQSPDGRKHRCLLYTSPSPRDS